MRNEEENNHSHSHNGDHGAAHSSHHEMMARDFRKRFWISLVMTVPVLLISPMIRQFLGLSDIMSFPGDSWVLLLISTAIYVYGGYPFLSGLVRELGERKPGMMTLIGMAVTVAYGYSAAVVIGLSGRLFFWELATLIDIMLLGHWVEMRSVMGASRALEELAKLMPSEAHRITGEGETEDVPVDHLETGDRVLVRPGEKIPVDGRIVEGETTINEAMVTGESEPVSRGAGEEVIGGSVNGDGSITVETGKTGEDSFLNQVVGMVRQAQESRSSTQGLADRAALWLTVIALSAGVVTLLVWYLPAGRELPFALTRAVTVMVITCPHALGLAIPLVVAVSTALGAKNGLLIRDRERFEAARDIRAIVFDKTGTLTTGEFGVSEVRVFPDGNDEQTLLNYAAAVESHSEHPIARGISKEAKESWKVSDFKAIPGKGAGGMVKDREIKVVSRAYLEEEGIEIPEAERDKEDTGKTAVYVLLDGEPSGVILLQDVIRESSREAVSKLKERGIETMMLTGDREEVAAWVAEELELDDYFAEVLPGDKADAIKSIKKRGLKVAMCGDGVNDAPALAESDLGIAIGAGTDVAVETADIVLVRDDPLDAVSILELSSVTYRKMVQNLIWATGYNAVAIPLAAGVLYGYGILLSPAVGAVLMSLSTVIVAINARIMKI